MVNHGKDVALNSLVIINIKAVDRRSQKSVDPNVTAAAKRNTYITHERS